MYKAQKLDFFQAGVRHKFISQKKNEGVGTDLNAYNLCSKIKKYGQKWIAYSSNHQLAQRDECCIISSLAQPKEKWAK